MNANETKETRSNRELWNNMARVHVKTPFYDVEGFLKGKCSLNAIDREVLGEVRGKSILHLQCHMGQDTLSLARRGAVVTGVDFSEVALGIARDLARQLQLKAEFIESDVMRLDEVLKGEFDIVYASFGVIGWHADLENWTRIVAHFLKKEGRFCFADFHPALMMLSDDHSRVAHSYFKAEPIVEENTTSYAVSGAGALGTAYGWNHSLGELFAALEAQGLTVRNFKEYDYSPYGCFPDAVEKEGRYYLEGLEHKLPLVYSLTAGR